MGWTMTGGFALPGPESASPASPSFRSSDPSCCSSYLRFSGPSSPIQLTLCLNFMRLLIFMNKPNKLEFWNPWDQNKNSNLRGCSLTVSNQMRQGLCYATLCCRIFTVQRPYLGDVTFPITDDDDLRSRIGLVCRLLYMLRTMQVLLV